MSSKPRLSKKEKKVQKKNSKSNGGKTGGDTCSKNIILGRRNWPDLSASTNDRGRSNNVRNDGHEKTAATNNDNSSKTNNTCPQRKYL